MQVRQMSVFSQLLQTLPDFVSIALLALLVFLVMYGGVRLLHRSEHWVLPGIGLTLLLFSLWRVLPDFLHQPDQFPQNMAAISSMVGLVAVVGALYAFGQYLTRVSYLLAKKRLRAWGTHSLRHILRFLRSIHQFLGWGVLVMVSIHACLYLPWFLAPPHARALSQIALLTGSIAWGVLAVLIGLGLWIEHAMGQKRLARRTHLVHIITAGALFIIVLVHIGLR